MAILIAVIKPVTDAEALSSEDILYFDQLLRHTRLSVNPFLPSAWLAQTVKAWSEGLTRQGLFWFLLLLSYGFYAAWDFRYLPLIFGSSTVDFFLARAIAAATDQRRRRALLLVTVVLNLGFLGFFKYWNFALENIEAVRALTASTRLNKLAALDLTGAGLPPATKRAVRKRWPFARL